MQKYQIALVLSGGNALGAYHAGVYEALHERGIEPDWIVGASIGAIVGAIIAGNAPEHRLERLQAFWTPAASAGIWDLSSIVPDAARRSAAALWTFVAGRQGVFAPVGPLGSWWLPDDRAHSPALYETTPLQKTLDKLVDFKRLQSGRPRFSAVAVDLETGDEAVFDTGRGLVGPDHIRASAALLATFPAIAIDGRSYVDGGFSSNLPLDPVLADCGEKPLLCIAADLLPLSAPMPKTMGETVGRMQDLLFAAQSRRTIERWSEAYARQTQSAHQSSVTLVRLAYSDQAKEVAGKAMDFSPASVRLRWVAGLKDARVFLDRLEGGDVSVGEPGLKVIR